MSDEPVKSEEFVVLLSFTDEGRAHADAAGQYLKAARAKLMEKDEAAQVKIMYWTVGGFDAVIAAEVPTLEHMVWFLAVISEAGYFNTQSLLCINLDSFTATEVPDRHHG
jgi:uncharacterized protein with GYD domain